MPSHDGALLQFHCINDIMKCNRLCPAYVFFFFFFFVDSLCVVQDKVPWCALVNVVGSLCGSKVRFLGVAVQ